MRTSHARIVCTVLIAVGVAASCGAIAIRARLEAANSTVAVVLDYDQLRTLAAAGGDTMANVLRRMKQAGATGVAVTEQTLYDVLSSGDVSPAAVRPEDQVGPALPRSCLVGSREVLSRVGRSLTERLGLGLRAVELVSDTPGLARLNVRLVTLEELADLGIGYPRRAVHEINLADLEVIARPRGEGNQWGAASTAALVMATETGARLVVFSGNAALGYPDNLSGLAAEIRKHGLTYGYVEFGKQHGDMALASRLPGDFLRVHSINETEMLGMTPQQAVDRFVLAVSERNVRVCYVRLFAPSGPDPMSSAEGYVQALTDSLTSHRFSLGLPEPLADAGVPWWLRWLACVGALAAAALCLIEFLGCRPLPVIAALACVAVLVRVGMSASLAQTTKLGALLAALSLPILAVAWHRPVFNSVLPRWSALAKGVVLFAASSAVSVLGGLLVVGCLADTRFMVKLDQFSGVKLAHMLPLLGVLVLQLGWDLGRPRATEGERPMVTLIRGWRAAAGSAVQYWHAALLIVCAASLALLVLRTGNESGLGVSGVELQFRSLLNRVFGVRPRSKEVLIGHPLLLLGLARMAGGKNVGRWLLLSLGAVGQVSLVNTFTHLHTPLTISAFRTLHGLWFGTLIGAGLYAAVEFAELLWRRWWPVLTGQAGPPPE